MKANKLALGTVQFGLNYGISNRLGQTPLEEAFRILNFAQSQGIDTLDTAVAYGNSEKVLGELKAAKSFKVVSKFIAKTPLELLDQLANSLANLKAKKLYAYLAHRPLDVFQNRDVWMALEELKNEGQIQKLGFSFSNSLEVERFKETDIFPDIIQIPFNFLDHRFVELAQSLKRKGTEIHVRSVFLQGLFFLSEDELEKFKPLKPIILGLQKKYAEHLPQCLMYYVFNQKFVDKIVIGSNSTDQLMSNLHPVEEFVLQEFINEEVPSIIEEQYINPALWKL